jgi:hypothetical protein
MSCITFCMSFPPLLACFIQVQIPYMEFDLLITNIMKEEVLFHLRNLVSWVGTIKFMHVNFGHLIPRRWRTPRGARGLSIFIMRRVRLFWVCINIITPEYMHQFVEFMVKGCGEFIAEGLYVFVNVVFHLGHSIV